MDVRQVRCEDAIDPRMFCPGAWDVQSPSLAAFRKGRDSRKVLSSWRLEPTAGQGSSGPARWPVDDRRGNGRRIKHTKEGRAGSSNVARQLQKTQA